MSAHKTNIHEKHTLTLPLQLKIIKHIFNKTFNRHFVAMADRRGNLVVLEWSSYLCACVCVSVCVGLPLWGLHRDFLAMCVCQLNCSFELECEQTRSRQSKIVNLYLEHNLFCLVSYPPLCYPPPTSPSSPSSHLQFDDPIGELVKEDIFQGRTFFLFFTQCSI